MCAPFGWIVPLIFLGVFIYFVFSRNGPPPFWRDFDRKDNYRRNKKDLLYEKRRLEEEVAELEEELNYLRKKVRDLENNN